MFTTKKEVENYLAGQYIECLICGHQVKAIGSHLYHKHKNIKVDDYKDMFGLPHSKGVVAKMTSKKLAIGLQRRKDLGDRTMIDSFTPEILWKAQHSPRKRPVLYTSHERIPMLKAIANKKVILSEQKISLMDWDMLLEMMKKERKSSWSLRNKPGIPSQYHIKRKRDIDPLFKKTYDDLVKSFHLKYFLRERVFSLSGKISQKEIAKRLDIGITTVKRILKLKK